jgi:hypothetical protein
MKLPRAELAKVPYLRPDVVGGRDVPLAPLWDGESWHLWIPAAGDTLMEMKPKDAGECSYFAKAPARPEDLHFPFVSLISKRASWPEVRHWLAAVVEDVHQLAAVLAKIDFLWECRTSAPGGDMGLRRFIACEVEYILTVCRSMFDQLQEILRGIWQHVTLLDADEQKRKKDLEQSFAKMVFRDNKLMTVSEIQQARRVPAPFAAAYHAAGEFLSVLRNLRDGIVHGGKGVPLVLVTPRGFVVSRAEKNFASLPMWKAEHQFNENVVSLRPALAHIVMNTFLAFPRFRGHPESREYARRSDPWRSASDVRSQTNSRRTR